VDWSNLKLICTGCGEAYGYDLNMKFCVKCGCGLTFELKLPRKFEYKSELNGIWKYSEILPKTSVMISLGEGNTHIHRSTTLGLELNVDLWFKDETIEPTGSYLDRSSALATSFMKSIGLNSITVYSKGNLGASIAAYAAKSGLKVRIHVDRSIDMGKLYQMVAYGAEVRIEKSMEQTPKTNIVDYDPIVNEAKKTIAWEIIMQLREPPEYIIIPMGEGGLAYHTYKALNEMKSLGLLRGEMPKIIGVQPEGCKPIVEAFESGVENVEALEAKTDIRDLMVQKPKYGKAALKAIKDSGGCAVAVDESEARKALSELARYEGVLAEPAASLTIAGLKKLIKAGSIERGAKVVCIITGSGLKDTKTLRMMALESPGISGVIRDMAGGWIGDTKLTIMKILSGGEMYGYQIWRELKDRYGLNIRIPTLYQHLKELMEEGYVVKSRSEKVMGRIREYYALTEKGLRAI
jgi:threonine synthase